MRLALVALVIAGAASAQGTSGIGQPQWRTMQGDEPGFSLPSFDDSAWPSGPGPRHSWLYENFVSGVRWYRASFQLPEDWRGQDLAVGTGPIDDAFQVFVEGARIGNFGSWEPKPDFYLDRHLAFPVPRGLIGGTIVHVAIRRWNWTARTNSLLVQATSGNGLILHPPVVGLAGTVVEREHSHILESLIANLFAIFASLFVTLCGWVSVALFRAQRNRPEYLWLGLSLLFIGIPRLLGIPIGLTNTPVLSFYFMSLPFLIFAASLLVDYFFLAEVAPRLRIPLRALGVLMALLSVLSNTGVAVGSYSMYSLFQIGATVRNPIGACVALVVALLCLRERRGDSLALALGLMVRTGTETFRTGLTVLLGGVTGGGLPPRVPVGPLLVDVRDVAEVVFAATLLGVFWVRFKREQRRQSIVEAELAAARQVQELLLASGGGATPRFFIEAVYRPANEVGGDFYQVLPGEDESVLVVVGDVSGKGLKAAMLVSAVVGSLRTQLSRRPGEVLAHLNRSLLGQTGGGFVTCCAVLFHADGNVEIANAGHVAPYLDGRGIAIEGDLPLALAADTVYNETTLRIVAESVTLLSDGVVEARNARGELFGFERTAELTRKSANEIADAAQVFGQDDDITVVTVRRVQS